LNIPGLELEAYEDENIMPISKFDLTLQAIETGNSLAFIFEYCTELFKEETIQRFTGYFKRILKDVPLDPGKPLKKLEIISEEEKELLLFKFNDTAAAYPQDRTIHQLFEEQASRMPDHVGVVGPVRPVGTVGLSYKKLNEQSGRLAGLLMEKGVLADDIVAIMMERSIEMIIGIIGILKSGAGYMPIDPAYPQERSDYMLKDSGAKFLINETFFRGSRGAILQKSPPGSVNLAYIIYTSGSTGKPKGVMIEHRNVVRLLFNDRFQFEFSNNDVWTMFHSYCFDFSVWEMYGGLLYGARLVIVPRMTAQDTEKFYELLCKERVTILNQTPPAFYQLADHVLSNEASMRNLNLRYVIFGGEALNPFRLKAWRKKYPAVKLINMYGITETTVHVTFKEITGKEVETTVSNIGAPIPTLSVYIMDRYMNLLPVGVAGELCVGGAGVGRGYLNRPELTRGSFEKPPAGTDPTKLLTILYKSGDLARWLAHGELEYLGRIDRQIKIRGYRIELGEIETRLLSHPGIKEAVVSIGTDRAGDSYLCAYLVTGGKPEVTELQEYLSTYLPAYMVPAYFVFLEKIPLTANGKVDRRALPAPVINTGDVYIAPANKTEERMVAIWAEVLEIEKENLSVTADFFQLGGHSLKATLLMSKIHKAFDINMPLKEIFMTPTVRGLSGYVSRSAKDRYISISSAEKKEYYPLSSAQKRLYVLHRMDEKGVGYNIPYFLLLTGEIAKDRFENSFRRLILRHESFRTSFHLMGDEPVQKIHDTVAFAIEYKYPSTDYTDYTDEKANNFIHSFIRPFDLSQAPLMRVALIKKEKGDHLLMVDMHHIVSDGMSMEILIRDFTALFSGNELPGINLQYKDYTEWQNRESERLLLPGKYWEKEFAGEIPILELPTDYPRPSVQSFEGNSVSFEIAAGISDTLKALAFETGTTIYMVLLALYTVFMARITGQEDIVVGSPAAGRRHADLEKIIGMFVNTLPLRNYPAGEKTFVEFLYEVKDSSLSAYENQDYQYEDLVDRVVTNRDASRNPLFDTMFTLQNTGSQTLNIPGLKLTPYEYENKTSKFDLSLTAEEVETEFMLTFEYCTKLFKQETIERFIVYFNNIVKSAIENKEVKISDFDILPEEEKKRILFDFNDTRADYPQDKTIQQLFSEQVAKTPDYIALVGTGAGPRACPSCLTYRQLNEQSDRLAGLLIGKGVLPDNIVAIVMERSIDQIIGIVGILKSGGAYFPIDPEHPQERIDYMLKDSGAKILINEKFFGGARGAVLQKSPPCSANLAYIIYTSGSTGRPKGVAVEHSQLVNFVYHMFNRYDGNVDCNDRCLSLTNIMFDVSVWEFFLPLLFGARLVLMPEQKNFDVFALARTILEEEITLIYLPPGLLKPVHEQLKNQPVRLQLNKMLVGVEPIRDDILEDYIRLNPCMKIINGYGPTETTICASSYNYLPHHPKGEIVSIGVPLSNNRIILLDAYDHIVPQGIPGEICISGDGVSRGYINNPELTAEKFSFNKSYFAHRTCILYKTGDMARFLPDGNLFFIGRRDNQLKIRGYRIELGEIENRLLKHPEIREAVVLPKGDADGDKCLAA
ncbi:MAG: hypothetical protein QG657_3512, partial [Acidobacteriota bacterium]|nr:hypothetical protein [Acidobacteriota bacterium]